MIEIRESKEYSAGEGVAVDMRRILTYTFHLKIFRENGFRKYDVKMVNYEHFVQFPYVVYKNRIPSIIYRV